MRFRAEVFAAAAAMAAAVWGGETVKLEVEPYAPIVLEAGDPQPPEGWKSKPLIKWYYLAPVRGIRSGNNLHVWAPPGTHGVMRRALFGRVVDEDGSLELFEEETRFEVTVRGATPPPEPEPPNPPEPPEPEFGPAAQVLILRDLDTDTPEEAAALVTLRTSDQFARPPPQLLILDKNQRTADGRPDPRVVLWAEKVPAGSDYPYVFVADEAGRIIWQGELEEEEIGAGNPLEWSR